MSPLQPLHTCVMEKGAWNASKCRGHRQWDLEDIARRFRTIIREAGSVQAKAMHYDCSCRSLRCLFIRRRVFLSFHPPEISLSAASSASRISRFWAEGSRSVRTKCGVGEHLGGGVLANNVLQLVHGVVDAVAVDIVELRTKQLSILYILWLLK